MQIATNGSRLRSIGIAIVVLFLAILVSSFQRLFKASDDDTNSAPSRPRLLLLEDAREACTMAVDEPEHSRLPLLTLGERCQRVDVGVDMTGLRAIVKAKSEPYVLLDIDLRSGIIGTLPELPVAVDALGFNNENQPTIITNDGELFVLRNRAWTAWRGNPLRDERNRFDVLQRSSGPFSSNFAFAWNETWPFLTCGPLGSTCSGVPSLVTVGTAGAGALYACGIATASLDPYDAITRGGEFNGTLEGPIYFESEVIADYGIDHPVVQYKDGYLLIGERHGTQRLINLATMGDVYTHVGRMFIVGARDIEKADALRPQGRCLEYWSPTVVVRVEPSAANATVTYSYGKGTEAAHPCGHFPHESNDTFNCGSAGGLYHVRVTAPGYRPAYRDVQVQPRDSCHGKTTELQVTLDADF